MIYLIEGCSGGDVPKTKRCAYCRKESPAEEVGWARDDADMLQCPACRADQATEVEPGLECGDGSVHKIHFRH